MSDNSLRNLGIGIDLSVCLKQFCTWQWNILKNLQESFAPLKYLKMNHGNGTEDDFSVK